VLDASLVEVDLRVLIELAESGNVSWNLWGFSVSGTNPLEAFEISSKSDTWRRLTGILSAQ